MDEPPTKRRRVCYCRVSRSHQREDLKRQVAYMQERFPDHEIITDIGSGINYKRPGLQALLGHAMCGALEEVVVAYRDRLARIAADLIQWVLESKGCRLVVLNSAVGTIEADLADDLLAIVNVFCCRANGRRKYSKRKAEEEATKEASGQLCPQSAHLSVPAGEAATDAVDGLPPRGV